VRVLRIALTALAVALLLLTAPVGKPRADPVAATAVVLKVVDGDITGLTDEQTAQLAADIHIAARPNISADSPTKGCLVAVLSVGSQTE
jgi:hypothetical protein